MKRIVRFLNITKQQECNQCDLIFSIPFSAFTLCHVFFPFSQPHQLLLSPSILSPESINILPQETKIFLVHFPVPSSQLFSFTGCASLWSSKSVPGNLQIHSALLALKNDLSMHPIENLRHCGWFEHTTHLRQ